MGDIKDAMSKGCNNCEDENSEMLVDGCGIKCSSCGKHFCLIGEFNG